MSPDISLDKAIGLFQRAIEADPFNASAHNNLGAALLSKGSFYDAAKQFEEAIRLVPSHPQPRTNLGLLYEQVGQLRNAQEQYEQALVVSPDYLPAIQSLARTRIRMEQRDARTDELLRAIVLRTSDGEWRSWAQKELSRISSFGGVGAEPSTRAGTTVPSR